ncbi:MAG: hypothetical protein ACUVR3_10955 [Candidatus Roseilinea sp.]|uniref:hypothetical protein n=1 Tax=Candidatus Roseilinea sp. TaxID=2838777 RepID=UPI00404B6755
MAPYLTTQRAGAGNSKSALLDVALAVVLVSVAVLVLAGLFRLFGPSIMVERWWDVVVRAALACVVFFLARRLSSWPAAGWSGC